MLVYISRLLVYISSFRYPPGESYADIDREKSGRSSFADKQREETVREFGVTSHMPAIESEVEHACSEEPSIRQGNKQVRLRIYVVHKPRINICIDVRCVYPRVAVPLFIPDVADAPNTNAPRVPPSLTSNSKTSGAGSSV